jgi:hypothetical protein
VSTALRIAVMLGVGLLFRAAALPAGRRLADRFPIRIPALLSYATAGTLAALVRVALERWSTLEGVAVWIAFGSAWGLIAGLMLPFSRKLQPSAAQNIKETR